MLDDEEFYPTVAFGFSGSKGQEKLHQMWIGTMGTIDWRPVPIVELGKGNAPRKNAIAGYVPEEDEEEE